MSELGDSETLYCVGSIELAERALAGHFESDPQCGGFFLIPESTLLAGAIPLVLMQPDAVSVALSLTVPTIEADKYRFSDGSGYSFPPAVLIALGITAKRLSRDQLGALFRERGLSIATSDTESDLIDVDAVRMARSFGDDVTFSFLRRESQRGHDGND
ncbi:MAG TPA: hypothetical protein VFT29_13735 [Gemmatimonadaceae bacterium]|nr:hypothetical protein [Gemmatimonadaceae bacterium]